MFSKYFQEEIANLRELGHQFSTANPTIASMLAERGGDPDVERLLEGFAFLTARIRERLDGAGQEISAGMAELLIPQLQRPIPSMSIVEFMPMMGVLRGRSSIPRGTELASRKVDGVACRFRTTMSFDLLPLAITGVQFQRISTSQTSLVISFQAPAASLGSIFHPEGLRIHLHGESTVPSSLLLSFLQHCKQVEVKGQNGKVTPLPPSDHIRHVGLDPSQALVDWPALVPDGLRTVQELFSLPNKFLFVDIINLDRAMESASEQFDLVFIFDRPPELPITPTQDNFRLHCSPVINLFQTTADPIRIQQFGRSHMLRAAGLPPSHAEIYDVLEVRSRSEENRKITVHRPFFDFRHEPEETAYFRLSRQPSLVDDGLDVCLTFLSANGASLPGDCTLSLDVLCSNRNLAAQLRTGDICVPTSGSPASAKFRNIAPVTPPVRPPVGTELHWRLLSHLALGQRSLTDAGTLRALLEQYNFQSLSGQQNGWANQMRINAIRSVSFQPVSRITKFGSLRGNDLTIEIDEAGFAGRGDAFLFGAVLNEVLAASVTINGFVSLRLRLQPSGIDYQWPARNGLMSIL